MAYQQSSTDTCVLGPDLLEVYQEAFEEHMLLSSCRRALLSLLPKKGDLGLLKNWRPVSLLCLDGKTLDELTKFIIY